MKPTEVFNIMTKSQEAEGKVTMRSTNQFAALSVACLILASACGTVAERFPVPQTDDELAEIAGIPEARFWGDAIPERMVDRLENWSADEFRKNFPAWVKAEHHYLALSGGGSDGAFGAGLMNGWTATGKRPEFLLVTGVSAGALIAPFAFLGPKYDKQLAEVYTTLSTEDLLETRTWTQVITGDSFADTARLRRVIDRFINDEVVRKLAVEHRRGRRLFIGTTNLDARRPVIWSLTHIAASDHPNARKLIGDVMLASASIPGAFPPVLIKVEKDGKQYDEMHVDGGVVSQVFVYPAELDFKALLRKVGVPKPPSVYVIRNSRLKPKWEVVEPDIFSLAGTSISSLIRTQGIGDLNSIYLLTERDGLEYRSIAIPDDFDMESKEPFDLKYMNALFKLGYEMAAKGKLWERLPPGAKRTRIRPKR